MMLEKIFDGGFSLEDFARPKDPKYQQLTQSISQLSEQIKGKLSKEDGELLDELLGQVYESQYMEVEHCFKIGFSAGLQLQRESTELLQSLNFEASL